MKRKHQYLIGFSTTKRALENNKNKNGLEASLKSPISPVKAKVLSLEIPNIQSKSYVQSNSETRIPQSPLIKKALNLVSSPKASRTVSRKYSNLDSKALSVSSPSNGVKQKSDING